MSEPLTGANPAPPEPAEVPSADEVRRKRASKIFVIHHFLKKPLAEAWREVKPDTEASDASCKQSASRELKWLNDTYPVDLGPMLEILEMGEVQFLEEIKRYLHATTRLKVGVEKDVVEDEDGRTTVLSERYLFEDVRDNRAWGDALAKWGHVLGYVPRRKAPTKVTEMPVQQQPHTKEEDLADPADTSVAAAPPTVIKFPQQRTHEEVQEELRQYEEDKKRERERGDLL